MARETLTRDQIVRAAVDLLDREDLEGFSMRALGDVLGSAATAVYWHVGAKENLIALAADCAWSEIALPPCTSGGWRPAAQRMAVEARNMLSRHLWMVKTFGSGIAYGPGKARFDNHILEVFETAGFEGADAERASAGILLFVLGAALGQAADAEVARRLSRGGEAQRMITDSLARAQEVAREFPRLRERLDARPPDYSASPGGAFEFGLTALLDGIEAGQVRRTTL